MVVVFSSCICKQLRLSCSKLGRHLENNILTNVACDVVAAVEEKDLLVSNFIGVGANELTATTIKNDVESLSECHLSVWGFRPRCY